MYSFFYSHPLAHISSAGRMQRQNCTELGVYLYREDLFRNKILGSKCWYK